MNLAQIQTLLRQRKSEFNNMHGDANWERNRRAGFADWLIRSHPADAVRLLTAFISTVPGFRETVGGLRLEEREMLSALTEGNDDA